jgi:TusA-related sulfurtransferase
MTFVRVKVALDELAEGDVLAISLNDGEPVENVPRSLKDEGHKVLRLDKQKDGSYRLLAKKGPEG